MTRATWAEVERARSYPHVVTTEQGLDLMKRAYERAGGTMAKKQAKKMTTTAAAQKKAAPPKASAKRKREGVERARYTKRLPVPVGAKRVAELAQELVATIRKRESIVERRREAMAGYRSQLSAIDEAQKELADGVDRHHEYVEVQCIEKLVVETNEIQVIRTDTGEVVETRTAEGTDRQEALFADGAGKGKVNPSLEDLGVPAGAIPADQLAGGYEEEDDDDDVDQHDRGEG